MTVIEPAINSSLTPLQRHHRNICTTCGDLAGHQHPNTCTNCSLCLDVLGAPPVPVEPISLYTRADPLREALTNYKNPDHPNHNMFTEQLVELMRSWFDQHRSALCSYGPIDGCVVVPSTRGRRSVLNEALTANPIDGLGIPVNAVAANRRTTPTRTPSPHLFLRTNEQPGKRLVLIDDVYVTGSTAQSAAHTLEDGLATIAYVLVIGRRINPVAIANEYGIEHPAYKTHQEPTS